jgi:cyclic pyranopterin phosphate synthase
VLRFIEYMDVGATNGWRMDEVLPSAEVVKLIHAELPLVQLDPSAPGRNRRTLGLCRRQRPARPGLGEIGVISSVTQAFCRDCNRARLSTEGKLYLCLFAVRATTCARCCAAAPATRTSPRRSAPSGRPQRPLFRTARLAGARHRQPAHARVEMSYIGG